MAKQGFTDLADEALVHKFCVLEREYVESRFKHSLNQLENTASLGILKRDMARLKTEVRKREAAQGLRNEALFGKFRSSFSGVSTQDGSSSEKKGFLEGIVDKIGANE